jgi:hypothetical protein
MGPHRGRSGVDLQSAAGNRLFGPSAGVQVVAAVRNYEPEQRRSFAFLAFIGGLIDAPAHRNIGGVAR